MPSEIETIGRVVSQISGVDFRTGPNGNSLEGKNHSGTGPVARAKIEYKPREGCQLTFDIATLPPEEKLLTAPILQTLYGPFPGVFTVKSSSQGATIYYRLQYPQIPGGLQGSTQLVKDLEQVKQIGEEIYRYLPIVTRSANTRMLYEGLPSVRYVEPLSTPLASRLSNCLPGDPSIMLDALLGQRILFLEVEDFYHRNLMLGGIATQLKDWDLSIGRFLSLRFSDHDLLDILARVPFALSVDISGYAFQHLIDEMEKLSRNVREMSQPLIGILPKGHPLIYQNLPEALIVSLVNINPEPDIWLQYFLEMYQPSISRQDKMKIESELLPAFSSINDGEIKPEIIESCVHRYFNRLRNKADHLKSIREFIFKISNT